MIDHIYPDHIYDTVRIDIMAELLTKEFIKLFPSLNSDIYKLMGGDVLNWFDGKASDLAPVHDFWNLADGIMVGSKLKQIVKTLTAQNYSWSQNIEIDLKNIKIVWPMGTLSEIGNPPYNYSDVTTYFSDLENKRRNMDLIKTFQGDYSPRDDYPIMLRESVIGSYDILDGNRRVWQAILYDKNVIKANVGKNNNSLDDRQPMNYWVTTGELRKIMSYLAICIEQDKQEIIESIRAYLKYIFKVSDIARINWNLRCRDHSTKIQEFTKSL